MADDLDSFFAKKRAAKAKKKNLGRQDVEVLAEKLERTVKEQEEMDRLEAEERERLREAAEMKQLAERQQAAFNKTASPEDSEWIEYQQPDVDLEKLNIKDYEFDEVEFEEQKRREAEEAQKQSKTWKVAPNLQPDGASNNPALPTEDVEKEEHPQVPEEPKPPEKPAKYVPPSFRSGGAASATSRRGLGAAAVLPNISDDMQFPSLADADKIDTDAEKKKKAPVTPWGAPKAPKAAGESTRTTWTIASGGGGASNRRTESPPEDPAASNQAPARPKPGSYVPPHLRTKEPTSLNTSNRFASLND